MTISKRDQAYFGGLVGTAFQEYERGQVAFIKHYLETGQTGKAKDAYDKLKSDYALSFKTTGLIEELLPIARGFGDRWFAMKLSAQYLRQSPRGYVKFLKKKKQVK